MSEKESPFNTDLSTDILEPVVDQNELDNIIHNVNKDLEHASTSTDKSVIIIKGRYKFAGSGIYGIFAILVNKDFTIGVQDNNYLETFLFASHFSDIYHYDLSTPWKTLEETYNHVYIKKEFSGSLTDRFDRVFKEKIHSSDTFLYHLTKEYNTNPNHAHIILGNIKELFYIMHRERQLDLEIFIEEIPVEELSTSRQKRISNEAASLRAIKQKFEKKFSLPTKRYSVEIPAVPILSPNNGIPAHELREGQQILVKLDMDSAGGRKWGEIFHIYHTNLHRPAPLIVATIDQIAKNEHNEYEIVIVYQAHQFSRFFVDSNIKLRPHIPNTDVGIFDPTVHLFKSPSKSVQNIEELLVDKSFVYMIAILFITLCLGGLAFIYF